MKEVSFFFDFSSPFAYLGSTQIEAVAARHGTRVRWRPLLLGALFKAVGTPNVPLFAVSEAKRAHYLKDMHRWAEWWNVPFRFPSRFPMNTVKPLRMVLAAPEAERPKLIHAIFAAYWVKDRDISDDVVLRDIADSAGFSGRDLVAATQDDAMKQRLRAATEEAEQHGIFGVPTFLVGELLFWGQDRLEFVEKALNGWRPKDE